MLDRTQAPTFAPIQAIRIPDIQKEILPNGLELYSANYASQEILKLELVFNAGSGASDVPGFHSLFSKLLLGGTSTKNGTQLIEDFDQYGGFVEISQNVRTLHLSLYGLNKYLANYLKTIIEILQDTAFPIEEIETQRKITKQGQLLNLEKPAYLANRAFKSQIFGETHPYGRSVELADIAAISQNDLSSFYEEKVKGKAFKVFVSGKVGEKEIELISETLGQLSVGVLPELQYKFESFLPESILIEKKDNMQSTLRIGKLLIGRQNPDFFKMMVCNTAFGGFFGSRLMKNIREDKGYTYGISSSITPVGDLGYYVIGADVVKENTVDTLNEIKKEVDFLQNTRLSSQELELVKNYMCGSFAGSITTSFEIMDRHKNIILNKLNPEYYNVFINNIQSVSADDVLAMAQKYLNMDSMTEVIVGEKI